MSKNDVIRDAFAGVGEDGEDGDGVVPVNGCGHFVQFEACFELDRVKIDVIVEGTTTSRGETSDPLSEEGRSMVGDASSLAWQAKRLIDKPE